MSTIVEFSIFPLDKGESLSPYVARALKLIKDCGVSGVIWYELMCCETYDAESYFFSQKMGERNIPMLILESDYSTANTGQLKTRIEAFIEILSGVME